MMPEAERDYGPDDELIPWDCDAEAAGEADTQDLINESEDDDE